MNYKWLLLLACLLFRCMNDMHAGNIVANDIYIRVAVNSVDNDISILQALVFGGNVVAPGPMVFISEAPRHGKAALNMQNRLITYTPSTDFAGLDSITYEGCLPGKSDCDLGKIYILVDDKVAPLNNFKVVGEKDEALPISKVTFINNYSSSVGKALLKITINVLPQKGILYQAGEKVTAGQEIDINALDLLYIPEDGFVGEDFFRWNAADIYGYAFETAMANIQIVAVGTAPFITSFNCLVNENDFYQFSYDLFSRAYIDTYGDALQYVRIETLPEHGVLKLMNATIDVGDSITSDNLNALAYQPSKNYIGDDAFEWRASNSRYFSTEKARVGIEVMKVNEAPWLWYENSAADHINYAMFTDDALDICLEFYDKHEDAVHVASITRNEMPFEQNEEDCYTLSGQSEPGIVRYVITLCDDESPKMCREVALAITVKEIPTPPQYHAFSYTMLEGERLEECLGYTGSFPPTLPMALPEGFSLSSASCFEYEAPFEGDQQHLIAIAYCDENGEYCDIYQLSITVEALPALVFYDGISPNDDGKNDRWIIENIQHYPKNRLKILNRWGELVYEAENYDNEKTIWEGIAMRQRERLTAGVYYYELETTAPYARRFRGTVLIKY